MHIGFIIPRLQFNTVFTFFVFQLYFITRCSLDNIIGLVFSGDYALLLATVVDGAANKRSVGGRRL